MKETFNIGMLIKLNPDLFPATVKDDELIADLGYPALMRHFIFEVEKLESDSGRGEIVYCKITNPEILKEVMVGVKNVKYEGSLVLLAKDIVAANTIVTLDYVIKDAPSREKLMADLFSERADMKARGFRAADTPMKDNWHKIQVLRGDRKGEVAELSGMVDVWLPKQKIKLQVKALDLPSQEEDSIKRFKQNLSRQMRAIRGARRKTTPEIKDVFGQRVEKLGGTFQKSGSLLEAYAEHMKTSLETDKKPVDPKATYVGVEIEFIYSGEYDRLKKLLISNKLHRYICLKQDGSLSACHNSGYKTLELTLICKVEEIEYVMSRLNTVFQNPEIDAYVNRSCGLHVHLDMRKRNTSLVFKNFVRVQNLLRGAQPVGRVKNTHCKPNDTDSFEAATGKVSGRAAAPRYSVVNAQSYAKHSTIEIRIHEGSTDCQGIINWVIFLNSIASHTEEIPVNTIKYAEDLAGRFSIDIPQASIQYIDERIKRFQSLAV